MVAVLLVALGWIVLQLVVVGPSRYYEWDEAIYVSQVAPGDVPDLWSAHRARGIVWLISPIASWSTSVPAIRIYLMVVSALALAGVTWLWSRRVGAAAILGAGFLAVTWPALILGGFVSPNLHVALLSLAAVIVVAGGLPNARDRSVLFLALVIAVACLFRPLDAFVLGASLSAVSLFMRNVSTVGTVIASASGWLLGIIPYWLEADRWGGLMGRLSAASQITEGGVTSMVGEHLALADGANMGPDPSGLIAPAAVAWWIGLLLLTAVAVMSERGARYRPATFAGVSGIVMSLPYLFYTAVSAPRFLLPTYALLTFAAAVGLAKIAGFLGSRILRVSLASVLIVPFALWHIAAADDLNVDLERGAGTSYELAQTIRREAGRGGCAFGSPYGAVVIHLASGCRGHVYKPTAAGFTGYDLGPLLAEGDANRRVYVVVPRGMPVDPPVDGWVRTRLTDLAYAKKWLLYQPQDQIEDRGA